MLMIPLTSQAFPLSCFRSLTICKTGEERAESIYHMNDIKGLPIGKQKEVGTSMVQTNLGSVVSVQMLES